MTNFTLAKRLFFCSDILKCITFFSDFSSPSYNMTNPTSWLDPWTCEIFYFPQSQTVTAISTNVGIYVTLAKGSIFCYDIWYLEIYHCRHPKVNITFALALKFIPSLSFTLFQFISGENTIPSLLDEKEWPMTCKKKFAGLEKENWKLFPLLLSCSSFQMAGTELFGKQWRGNISDPSELT